MNKISFSEGFRLRLQEFEQPVFTDYLLFRIVLGLLETRSVGDHSIDIRTRDITNEAVKNRINHEAKHPVTITRDREFAPNPDAFPTFPRRVWINVAAVGGTAEQVACLVDPFCYISHLSAMQVYGLTDRNPRDLFVTIPGRNAWRDLSTVLDDEARGDHEGAWVKPVHITLPKRLRKRGVRTISKEHLSRAPITQADGYSRIVPIGQCFVDMLTEPDLCGGMAHCIDTFREHGPMFLDEILAAVEADPRPIVKVRAGYILNEVLGIMRPEVDAWAAFAQRGSSRKLDAKAPFDGGTFSEKWMISLNV